VAEASSRERQKLAIVGDREEKVGGEGKKGRRGSGLAIPIPVLMK